MTSSSHKQSYLKPLLFVYLIPFIIGMLMIIAYNHSLNEYSEFKLKYPRGYSKSINFPYTGPRHGPGTYEFQGKITPNSWTHQVLNIIPDDRVLQILINDQQLPLDQKLSGSLSDYKNGFEYDISPYLQAGPNDIQVRVQQIGTGIMGLKFSQPAVEIFVPLATLFLVLWLSFILYHLKLHHFFIILFAVGAGLRLLYFAETPYDVRGHDLGDHFSYVQYMAQHWFPPSIEAAMGGAFFHPPFYYYCAGLVYFFASLFDVTLTTQYFLSQCLSLIFSLVFLFMGLKTIEFVFQKVFQPKASNPTRFHEIIWIASSLLFATWPVAIVHSVRIGNDPLLYALFSVSLFFIVKWYYLGLSRYVLWASFWGGLATLTKANGVILLAVLGSLFLINALRKREIIRHIKLFKWPILFFGISLGITFAPGVILKLQGKRETLYVDNINNVSSQLKVGNTPKNYLYFDLETFLTEPFTSPWKDELGRQYFPNYLAKTGLFGEFDYQPSISRHFAEVISFFFVCLIVFHFIGIYRTRPKEWYRLAPFISSFLFLLAGVTYMRATFPVNIDFRYILPILIPFVVFSGVSILYLHQQGLIKLRNLGVLLMFSFSLANAFFFLGLQL